MCCNLLQLAHRLRGLSQAMKRITVMYSEVPNKSVTFFILFLDFFLPTWPY